MPFHRVVGALFAISLALTGLFPHAPLVQGVKSQVLFDTIHSVGASSAGFCFTFLAFGHGIMNLGSQRILGISAAISATYLHAFLWLDLVLYETNKPVDSLTNIRKLGIFEQTYE